MQQGRQGNVNFFVFDVTHPNCSWVSCGSSSKIRAAQRWALMSGSTFTLSVLSSLHVRTACAGGQALADRASGPACGRAAPFHLLASSSGGCRVGGSLPPVSLEQRRYRGRASGLWRQMRPHCLLIPSCHGSNASMKKAFSRRASDPLSPRRVGRGS